MSMPLARRARRTVPVAGRAAAVAGAVGLLAVVFPARAGQVVCTVVDLGCASAPGATATTPAPVLARASAPSAEVTPGQLAEPSRPPRSAGVPRPTRARAMEPASSPPRTSATPGPTGVTPVPRPSAGWTRWWDRAPDQRIHHHRLSTRGTDSVDQRLSRGGPGHGELAASASGLVGTGSARLAIAGPVRPDYATCTDVVGAGRGNQRLPFGSLDQGVWVCFYSQGRYARLQVRRLPSRFNPAEVEFSGQLWRHQS